MGTTYGLAEYSVVLIVVLYSMVSRSKVAKLLEGMRRHSANTRFKDLVTVCDHYFGIPRQAGTSHRIYRTPWPGDPRVNIQAHGGNAKAYQVRQVIRAIEKLEEI